MAIGFRAFLNIERPEKELVNKFRGIPSSNIGDCVKKMNCMFGGIHSFNDKILLGTAFTVKVPSGDNLAAQVALDYAQPGDIIVVDGAVRDLEDIHSSSLPVFALSATPLGPYREGPGEINVPVVCGGQVVMPGDILVGDVDGIVVIPQKDAEILLKSALKNLADEQEELRQMKDGTYIVQEHKDHFTKVFTDRGGSFEN